MVLAWLMKLLHSVRKPSRKPGRLVYKLNVNADKRDEKDAKYIFKSPLSESSMPDEYVIPLKYHSEIKSQGNVGSCASHVAADLVEMEYRIQGIKRIVPLSELWHYKVVRGPEYMNSFPKDSGQYARDMCKVLKEKGIAPESLWPYDASKYNETPPAVANAFASFYKIKSYHRILDIENIKKSIALNHPVAVGIFVFDSFMRNRTGDILMPENEIKRGGHEIIAVGYSKERKAIKIKNSWASRWGQGGYAWIPEEYFNLYGLDYWSVRV